MSDAGIATIDRTPEPGIGVFNKKLGMWVYLLSEVMYFTSLIGSYIILRYAHPDHFAEPGVLLNVNLTAANTFLLICSSVSMVKAFSAIQQGNVKGLQYWLLATIVMGASFVGVQIYEYIELGHEGFLPALADYTAHAGGPLYGATFYAMTGFHGAHVSLGVLALIFVYIRALRGEYTVADHEGVEVIGLYWHFVDLVWIILFTIVYLI